MLGLSAVVLLLVLSPFIVNYVRSTIVETSNTVGYEQTLAILQERFLTMDSSSPFSAAVNFFAGRRSMGFDVIWYAVWFLGLAGLFSGLIWRKNSEEYAHLRQIAAWMIGILIVGGLVPALEQVIFAYLERIPPEFEILKTLRYLVPLVLVAAVYALWLLSVEIQRRNVLTMKAATYLFLGTAILLLLAWGLSSQFRYPDFRNAVRQNLICWRQGKLVCPLPQISMDLIDVLDVVREDTPVGSRIFSEGQEVAVRYYALRPLVFTYKDGAPLAYTDQEQLLVWNEHSEAMEELTFIRKFPFRHRAFVRGITELAQTTHADYLLLQEPFDAGKEYPEQLNLIYSNASYSLYELPP